MTDDTARRAGRGLLRIGVCGALMAASLLSASCGLLRDDTAQRETARDATGGLPVRIEPSAAEVRAAQMKGNRGADGASQPEESLLDTYWKLIELGGRPVVVREQQREPHLILHGEGSRVSGHGGCNRLSGSYQLAQDRLTFGGLASTKMACADGLRDEARFTGALTASARWQIDGQFLELLDQAGARIARFEVRHL